MLSGIKPYLPCALPFTAAVVGAVMACFGLSTVMTAMSSDRWPSTMGTIVASSVHRVRDSSRERKRKFYQAEVRYEFTVNGITFSGDCVSFGNRSAAISPFKEQLEDRFRRGKAVSVSYNPRNPKQCVLQPGLQWESFSWLVGGCVLLFTGGREAISLALATKRLNCRQESSPEPPNVTPKPPLPPDSLPSAR